jgi:DNA modification methylase
MIAEFSMSEKVYETSLGLQVCADSRDILKRLPLESVDLIVTSPPFALLRKKAYGNEHQGAYVKWLSEFGALALPALKQTGSFVIDLGGAYQYQRPVRSLYNYRVLLEFCDILGYNLAEEFFWYNPSKLPSPIEWVNKRKIRAKDAVNTIWWFAKSDSPKADVTKVLTPYSERMKTLLKDPAKFYRPKDRPSGHNIASSFGSDNGGAIPSNLLQIPNTDSNSHYLRMCKVLGKPGHPARFPVELPRFFIKFLTDPGDVVVDIFSGSNTTGFACEIMGRRWLSIEQERDSATLSAVRFLDGWPEDTVRKSMARIEAGRGPKIELSAPPLVQADG